MVLTLEVALLAGEVVDLGGPFLLVLLGIAHLGEVTLTHKAVVQHQFTARLLQQGFGHHIDQWNVLNWKHICYTAPVHWLASAAGIWTLYQWHYELETHLLSSTSSLPGFCKKDLDTISEMFRTENEAGKLNSTKKPIICTKTSTHTSSNVNSTCQVCVNETFE